MGYMGVKVFPVHEQLMSTQPFNDVLNPWSFMYQPVSYRLQGRMGTRDELRQMINTCRGYGVRVYADAVINHMTGGGNDANPKHRNPDAGCAKWPNKTSSLSGGHSPFYTQNFVYSVGKHTGQPPMQEFPAVPYGPTDFHCERSLNSWSDPVALNAGWLVGLTDLNTERENVQDRIADYLTDLIGIGFSGFRVDAAKHIKPEDLVGIFSKLRRNLGGSLPSDFFTWLEIILGGEADLLMCNPQSGYNYGSSFTAQLGKAGFSKTEIEQIKTWNSGYPKEPAKGSDDCSGENLKRMVIQNDDHDQQNPGSSSRDMGEDGCVLIKGR
jgi:alpha-amylase